MPKEIVERLRCPTCGGPVGETSDQAGIRCDAGHRFAMRDGYLDCGQGPSHRGSIDRTFASFGFEWNNFDEMRRSRHSPRSTSGTSISTVSAGRSGWTPDAGEGAILDSPHLGAMAALDSSSAVEAAARNLGGHPSVLVVKSDLRAAPFAPERFDFIASLGVLHYLDDPREGFARLVAYLAPGGRILLYLYSRPSTIGPRAAALRLASALRTVTVRLPFRVLKVLSVPIAVCLYCGVVVPGDYGDRRGVSLLSALPMDAYRGKTFRSLVLDTFDRLSAPVEHRYVWKDLAPWFSDAGLVVDASRDETGWFVLAHKP